VHHAHEQGVIHRDLKPPNILVTESEDGIPRPKILDFGVARALRAELQTMSLRTQTGQLVGTLAYMSPEQILRASEDLDARSDVYQLGVILYELLAGRRPFAVTEMPLPQATRRILEEEPPPLRTVDSRYRGDVEAIVGKALSRERRRRYASAAELAADLRRHLSGEPIMARPASGFYRLRKFAQRRREAVGGLAVGLVAAVALVAALQLTSRDAGRGHADRAEVGRTGEPRIRRITAFPQTNVVLNPGEISPDGRLIAVPHHEVLDVIDVETGESRRIVGPDPGEIYSAHWLPDSETLVTFEYHGDVPWRMRARDPRTRTAIWTRRIDGTASRSVHEDSLYVMLWPVPSPDGRWIAYLQGDEEEIWLVDAAGKRQRRIREIPGGVIRCLAWSPDSDRVCYMRNVRTDGGSDAANIETCDLHGDTTVVVAGSVAVDWWDYLGGLCWLPDGRLVHRHRSGLGQVEFWSVPVDLTTGQATGEPAELLVLPGSSVSQPSASADGERLAFYRVQAQYQPRLVSLNDGEGATTDRWGLQDWLVWPGDWSRDGQRFFYTSLKDPRDWDIHVTDLASGLEGPVVRTPQMEWFQSLTPDGREILFWQGDVLRRMPIDGGPAVDVIHSPVPLDHVNDEESVFCAVAPATRCLLALKDGDATAFHELDIRNGVIGAEIARAPARWGFDLSPDGTRIAFMKNGLLYVHDLREGTLRELPRVGWKGTVRHVSWSHDGTWLCAAGVGGEVDFWVRRVHLDGTSAILWHGPGDPNERCYKAPRVSPDGSRMAIATSLAVQNVWIAEDF
jgi:Tol biopolymer transport system component